MSEPAAKPIDYQAERCGHNFPPEQCPHDDCGYREALARIAELESENAALRSVIKDQCENEKEVMELTRPILGSWVDGDSYGVPGLVATVDELIDRNTKTLAENAALKARLLTAAGDDLCRLTQDEIKALTGGAVQIPPKEEFLASCERFHAQIAGEVGVNEQCLTLAQMIAENASLKADNERMQAVNVSLAERVAKQSDLLSKNAERAAIDAAKRQQETPGQSGSLPEKTPISP